ncbi:thioredoxin [bacterium]|jgi:thioredoxin 1|nr:thioredoxin [bacterium]|tara:strand:+ start:715 stop:1038 length:324 start_codon:yes stop_codon:yes gene_type:complete
MSDIKEINDDDFQEEVLNSEVPVLVDFWAPWCGPCKILAPTLEEISTENREKIKIVKINIDENQLIAGRYGIKSIPTMMIFEKGELKNQLVGSMPKQEIEKVLFTEI